MAQPARPAGAGPWWALLADWPPGAADSLAAIAGGSIGEAFGSGQPFTAGVEEELLAGALDAAAATRHGSRCVEQLDALPRLLAHRGGAGAGGLGSPGCAHCRQPSRI